MIVISPFLASRIMSFLESDFFRKNHKNGWLLHLYVLCVQQKLFAYEGNLQSANR